MYSLEEMWDNGNMMMVSQQLAFDLGFIEERLLLVCGARLNPGQGVKVIDRFQRASLGYDTPENLRDFRDYFREALEMFVLLSEYE